MTTQSPTISRRTFMALAGSSALSFPLMGQEVLGANDRVRVALIGCGGRGHSMGQFFTAIPNVEVVAVCDPDTHQMQKLLARLQKNGAGKNGTSGDLSQVAQIQDYRKLLERDDIDAVAIASPNYWHALHAITAMQAGKDVYLEKPVSHSIWEGQQLIAAEKKYGRIIAAGYQNRSDPGPRDGIRFVQEGHLGKILSVHVCCFRNRDSIGPRLEQPMKPPATCDYNLWLGPAQDEPILRKRFHYDWHWVWNTGNGDIGNQAPHEIDLACWVLGDSPLPSTIQSAGGRFAWNDAGETPNLITSWYEQADTPVIIEVNDLKLSPERNAPHIRNGIRVGIVVRCEGGELRGGRGGMYVVGDDGKTKLHKFPGDGGRTHQQNFIDAVRSRKSGELTSSILSAERSAAIAHLANISLRSGSVQDEAAVRKAIGNNTHLNTIFDEQAKQLAAWGIDAAPYSVGNRLTIDPKTLSVKGDGVKEEWIRTPGRGEFHVPELG